MVCMYLYSSLPMYLQASYVSAPRNINIHIHIHIYSEITGYILYFEFYTANLFTSLHCIAIFADSSRDFLANKYLQTHLPEDSSVSNYPFLLLSILIHLGSSGSTRVRMRSGAAKKMENIATVLYLEPFSDLFIF